MRSLLETEKLFLNPQLNVQVLAERLKIPRTYVSYMVSRFTQKNFYDFINDYRLIHAKMLMKNMPSNGIKIIDIAFESGFNSKSTFYTFFKIRTGQTPQEYIDDLSHA
jgi:AraC-like DNA-binding protein